RRAAPGVRRALQGRLGGGAHRPQGPGRRLARGRRRRAAAAARGARPRHRLPRGEGVRRPGAPPAPRRRDARGRVPARARPRGPGLMPIYDQGYRRYEARGPLRKARFWPITREALRLVLVKRGYIGLMVMAWIPFVVRTVIIYAVTRFPQARVVMPMDGT